MFLGRDFPKSHMPLTGCALFRVSVMNHNVCTPLAMSLTCPQSCLAVRQSQFNRLCNPERGWAFERVLDGGLDGYDHKTIPGTETRADCARLCLLEEDFDCRSAEYSSEKKRCVLSREDRRTQPEAFRTSPGVDYIENQCAKRE